MSNENMEMQTSPIEEILADYKSGQMVILVGQATAKMFSIHRHNYAGMLCVS